MVFFAFSAACTSFSKDLFPKPSISVISSLYLLSVNSPASPCSSPFSTSFSIVASDIPSIFIASLLTKCEIDFIFLARHSSFSHTSTFTPFSSCTDVFFPHTGHSDGTFILELLVRFCAICGIIIFALYTCIISPSPSCSCSIILKLCTLALDTVVPSSSTGSNIAIGFISPVLDALHSIPSSFVSAISSAHLNAIEFLGNFAVLPSESPYAISSYIRTRPSDGKLLEVILSWNHFTVSTIFPAFTILYSTISKPCPSRNFILFSWEFPKSRPSASTSANA